MQERIKGMMIKDFVGDYVVVDIETTGLKASMSEIIEIGAIKVHQHEIIDSFNVLIKASTPIPPFITSLTGIDDALLVKQGLDPVDAFSQFLVFVEDAIVLGHNVNFDIGFLFYHLLDKIGVYFTNDYMDTLYFSRKYLGKNIPNHKLETLTKYFGFAYDGAHRGLQDCQFTYQVYQALLEFSCGFR